MDKTLLENVNAAAKGLSTVDGWDMLHLPNSFEFNYAANSYIIALEEINKLRTAIAEARKVIEPLGTDLLTKPIIGTHNEIIKQLGNIFYDKLPLFRAAAEWLAKYPKAKQDEAMPKETL